MGPFWRALNAEKRFRAGELSSANIPKRPGVYAWYEQGRAIYVGKASDLRTRLGAHLSRGMSLGNSAFRRNIAEEMKIATARDIKSKARTLTKIEVARVTERAHACFLAWQ